MQYDNDVDDNEPIQIKPVNYRSHAVHSFDEISEVGFEKMLSSSEPAAVPRPEVSLSTPKEEISKRNSMDFVSAKKKFQIVEESLSFNEEILFQEEENKKEHLNLIKIPGKPQFCVVSNSEESEFDMFGSKSLSNKMIQILSESMKSDSSKKDFDRQSVKCGGVENFSSCGSKSSVLKHEGEASWTLQKQQEIYKEIQ